MGTFVVPMREDLVDQVARQLLAAFRSRDPGDPGTRADLLGSIRRVRQVTERLSHEVPEVPPVVPLSDSEAEEIFARVLAGLS
jgi:hypothetical protein